MEWTEKLLTAERHWALKRGNHHKDSRLDKLYKREQLWWAARSLAAVCMLTLAEQPGMPGFTRGFGDLELQPGKPIDRREEC